MVVGFHRPAFIGIAGESHGHLPAGAGRILADRFLDHPPGEEFLVQILAFDQIHNGSPCDFIINPCSVNPDTRIILPGNKGKDKEKLSSSWIINVTYYFSARGLKRDMFGKMTNQVTDFRH
jgi:hypothetical protein